MNDDGTQMRRVAAASAIGTTIEFYDFAIFGTAAALVFSKVFFPSLGSSGGLALSLATVGVAFVARPFGAILFGHFGDRFGRKATLVATLLTMGGATVAVGITPSSDTIGPVAAILLVIFRVLQGLAVGGEWAGASLLTAEHAPANRRGFYGAFPQLGPSVGFMLACASFLALSTTLTDEQFLAWGWRIPFVASAILVLVGLYIRLTISEPEVFRRAMENKGAVRYPLVEVFRKQWRAVLLATGATTYLFGLFYVGVTYLTSYATGPLALDRSTVLGLNILGAAAMVVTTFVGASLSDRVGRRPVCLAGSVLGGVAALALFPIIDRGTPLSFLAGLSILIAAVGVGYGVLAAYLPEMFSTRYRYTGAGVSYAFGSVLGGAFTPVVAVPLADRYGSSAIGMYLAGLCVIATVCILATRESVNHQMAEDGDHELKPEVVA